MSETSASESRREPRAPQLSVVIPFFNEEECLLPLLEEVGSVMEGIAEPYEILAVDDGSSDRTPRLIAEAMRANPSLRLVRWEQNRGQAAALLDGLRLARAPVLITLDGDGQNDPADIPRLLARLEQADMVVGIRAARSDSRLRRWMSRFANAIRGRVLGDHMSDSGCALKVFRREVVDALVPIKTLYSFIPALAIAGGFEVIETEVRHRPRQGGTSSYGLRKMLWLPALDMLGVCWLIHRRVPPPSDRPGRDRLGMSFNPAETTSAPQAAESSEGRAR